MICSFPKDVRQNAGYQLRRVQDGNQPVDFKPMPDIGKGVEEIRIWSNSGTYRVIYTARVSNNIYVLHAFQKKTLQTPVREKDVARRRLKELMRGRG